MERQVSVGTDRPVKEDHLWRWTTLNGKFPRGPKRSIYFSTEISENFGIMESTHNLTSIERKPLFRGMGNFLMSPDTFLMSPDTQV